MRRYENRFGEGVRPYRRKLFAAIQRNLNQSRTS